MSSSKKEDLKKEILSLVGSASGSPSSVCGDCTGFNFENGVFLREIEGEEVLHIKCSYVESVDNIVPINTTDTSFEECKYSTKPKIDSWRASRLQKS